MAPIPNPHLVFSSFPIGYPVPGKDISLNNTRTIDPDTLPLNGGILTRTLWLSLDPYQRGRMAGPHVKRYSPRWALGATYVVRSCDSGEQVADPSWNDR